MLVKGASGCWLGSENWKWYSKISNLRTELLSEKTFSYYLICRHEDGVHAVERFRLRFFIASLLGQWPPLQKRHNEQNGVLYRRQLHYFPPSNVCFGAHQGKKSKLGVTGLCEGNPLVSGGFPHKAPVTRKMFPFDYVIMLHAYKINKHVNKHRVSIFNEAEAWHMFT